MFKALTVYQREVMVGEAEMENNHGTSAPDYDKVTAMELTLPQ